MANVQHNEPAIQCYVRPRTFIISTLRQWMQYCYFLELCVLWMKNWSVHKSILIIEAHLQIFEAYCSNFWPVIWWSALFNHKWRFTCYVWVLKNSFNWYHLIFCIANVPYNWSLQNIQIYSICHRQPCNACQESNSRWVLSLWLEFSFEIF